MNKKRKRNSKQLKPPQLPIELWEIVAEQVDEQKDLYNLLRAVPTLGRHSLSELLQDKLKERFIITAESFNKSGHRTIEWLLNGGRHRGGDLPAYESFYNNGNTSTQRWYKDGNQYRKDSGKPIFKEYYEDGKNIKSKLWENKSKTVFISYYLNYKIKYKHCKTNNSFDSNNDNPPECEYYEDGTPKLKKWYDSGRLYRGDDLPAVVEYHSCGKMQRQAWYTTYETMGMLHRDKGLPAVVKYYPSGKKKCEEWYEYGVSHCINGPSEIHYWENGNRRIEEWYREGFYYRNYNEPTTIEFYENGTLKRVKRDTRYITTRSDNYVKTFGIG